MILSWRRVAVGLIAGVMAGPIALAVVYALRPQLVLEFDRRASPVTRSFYEEERNGDDTYAWTSREASITTAGLDRRIDWVCTLRFRAPRPDPATMPRVTIAVDGSPAMVQQGTADYAEATVIIPSRRPKDGARVTIAASQTFQPGGGDQRQLGVMVDRWACTPAGRIALPPRSALNAAAASAALFGVALALLGVAPLMIAAGVILVATLQAFPMAQGIAPFTVYAGRVPWMAAWVFGSMLLIAKVLEWLRGRALRHAARFVLAFSAAVLFLRLAGVLHPSKLIIDAVFHAHRLDWVLAGKLLFTQPLGGGVNFPYAIGLYVFAAPWSLLTTDHVALLRVVVCAAEVIAGAFLYPVIVRSLGDRRAAAAAVALFSLIPLSYGIVGSANLTNAFGQSAALVAVAAATLMSPGRAATWQLAGVTALIALAIFSHVSTFALLVATLAIIVVLYRLAGGPDARQQWLRIAMATTVAVVIAIALYYGRFIDDYRAFAQVRGAQTAATPSPAAPAVPPDTGIKGATSPSPVIRLANGLTQTSSILGWPLLVLAGAGAWRLLRDGWRTRAGLAVLAWLAAYVVFLIAGSVTPIRGPYQRYAVEFIARVAFATYPAAVILAGIGAAWAWRAGWITRVAAAALLGLTIRLGLLAWFAWVE